MSTVHQVRASVDAARARGRRARNLLVVLILVAAVVPTRSTAQIVLAPNPFFGSLAFLDRDGQILGVHGSQLGIKAVATDGVTRHFALGVQPGALRRYDASAGLVASHVIAGQGLAIALRGADELVLARTNLSGGSVIECRHDDGTFVWTCPLSAQVRSLAVDRDGITWALQKDSSGYGTIARIDAAGNQFALHPAGLDPVDLEFAPNGEAFAVCRGSSDVWRYLPSGELLDIVPVASAPRALTVDPSGELILVYSSAGRIERRAPSGVLSMEAVLPEMLTSVGHDGLGRLWRFDFSSGSALRTAPWLESQMTRVLLPGLDVDGDFTGHAFAAEGGRALDPDGDGVPSGDEIDVGFDPFDAGSIPFDFELAAPIQPLATVPFLFAAPGRTGLYRIALSLAPAENGQGPLGFSLAPSPLFDWSQEHVGALFDGPLGLLDGNGEAIRTLHVPDYGALAGLVVCIGFVVHPDPSDPWIMVASPAYPIVLP